MELSIIVVNYNVKHFLEQCLHSVQEALHNIDGEVIILDNNSVDGSPRMVREKFPAFTLIENQKNLGFSKANNQGIRIARGQYVLLLNPDTIVQEDTFEKCLKFMEDHPDAGAMGVKMIDGQGHFLPESKRALPTPSVAFYKMFGLSKVFPRSSRFNRYHLGHLDPDQTHIVDVLPGAFMCIRKTVIDQIGGLDEDYFMYGEDVDLSFRITNQGFRNYYVPGTTIIHFKGESTRKGSLNYVALFYKAMAIFAAKHFNRPRARLYSLVILAAIYFRATLSGIKRIFRLLLLPILDLAGMYFGYQLVIHLWGTYKFSPAGGYPDIFTQMIAPIYVLAWISGIIMFSGYHRPYRYSRALRGILASTILLLLVYALLPMHLRFSRALIILGSLWAAIIVTLWRSVFLLAGGHFIPVYRKNRNRILIIADAQEAGRIRSLIGLFGMDPRFAGSVTPRVENKHTDSLGTMQQLPELITYYHVDEIIFSADDISVEEIIYHMVRLADYKVQFKIAPPRSMSVIGSSSRHRSGDLYFQEANPMTSPGNKRMKRSIDILISLGLLIVSPLLMVGIKKRVGFFKNVFTVLVGDYTWVGPRHYTEWSGLPIVPFKPAILSPANGIPGSRSDPELAHKIEMNYVQNYRYQNDVRIVFQGLRDLGQNPSGD